MILGEAIITDGEGSFTVGQIALDPPEANEVLVEIKASGVCHTDCDSMSWGEPCIMGHEGSGIVLEIGTGVTHVQPGDRVLLNWAIPCGTCFQCSAGAENICENKPSVPLGRIRYRGIPIRSFFQLGTMASHTVVPSQAVVKLEVEIRFPSAAILGCGVMTGFGSVVNVAKVHHGESVVVLGTGGVGLSVIQGAVHAKAGMIIALDINPSRLELATRFGATHAIQTNKGDTGLLEAAKAVRALTGRGADYAFECTAVPELGAAPLAMIRNGGYAVAVSGIEEFVSVDMELFQFDKRYINPLYGQCRPFVDFPRLLNLYHEGKLKLDEMVTRTYPLRDLQTAFAHMLRGENAKGVLLPHGAPPTVLTD